MGRRLDFEEHFEWGKDSCFRKPWDRKFLNRDFLKNEKARIEKTKEWRSDFLKAKNGEEVLSINLFVHEVREVYSGWAKPIRKEVGDYVLKVLSPLKNDNQIPVLALFPLDKTPEDFAYVKIEKASKQILFNDKLERHANFMVVEEYSYLEPDERFLVVDVDFEKNLISDILKENLGYDKSSATGLEAPLISSPSTGKVGGIGMTSLDQHMGQVNELFGHLERALPFEYRTATKPPKSAVNGKFVSYNGWNKQKIDFKVAEKVFGSSSTVSSRIGHGYNVVSSEKGKRMKADGEYSYLTSMDSKGTGRDLLQNLRNRFAETEVKITDPTRKGELVGHIKDLGDNITNYEDLKLNTVYSRQHMPSTSNIDKKKWEDRFRDDWQVYSADMGLEYDSRMFLTANAQKTLNNALNVGQSIARMCGKEKVDDKIMKETLNMFENEVERLIDHPVMKDAKEQRKEIRKEDVQNALRQLLTGSGFTKDQIWELVKSEDLFRDRARFEDIMDRLHERGYIFEQNGKFFWA